MEGKVTMNLLTIRGSRAIPLVIFAGALLSACGGGGSGGGTPPNLTGTAATGAPVVGAMLSAKCQNGTFATATTSAAGTFGLNVPRADFPCALQVSGGNLPAGIPALYSFAASSGNTNVTPLTDLALAMKVNSLLAQSLTNWFANPAKTDEIANALAAASDALRSALAAAGYTVPSGWGVGSTAPFSAAFTPNPASDPFDKLLETLAAAIKASTLADFAALRDLLIDGGSLPEPASSPDPIDPVDPSGLTPIGTGAALAGSDGATGTLSGTTYTYTANVGWDTFGGATGVFGAYKPVGSSFDGVSRWTIDGLPATIGTHSCNVKNGLPRVMLFTGAGAPSYSSANCVIQVTAVTSGAITGRFATDLVSLFGDGKSIAGTVTDGYFRKAVSGIGEALPAGEVGASFKVDGETYRYVEASDFSFEDFAGLIAAPQTGDRANPGFPVGIQINSIPNALGTYACDSFKDNAYRKANIWFYWYGKTYIAGARASIGTGPDGSSCSVTVTKPKPNFEGSFSGTFINEDGDSLTVTDGLFRLQ